MGATLSAEDAEWLAGLLNQICTVALEALIANDLARRLEVAASLREVAAQVGADSTVTAFLHLLVAWLEGDRPTDDSRRALEPPFRRALEAMLQQVPAPSRPRPATAEPEEPISRHVLAQLVSAAVAAVASGDAAVQNKLATQLLNIQSKLSGAWRGRLSPLLENLRAVLGGADARTLPAVSDPLYQRFWLSALELLIHADLREESAHGQLMERLIHNTLFVAQAQQADLTEGFLRSLLDVQRQALDSQAPSIATLVGAIRARLQGLDPTPFTALLDEAEQAAWLRILTGLETLSPSGKAAS